MSELPDTSSNFFDQLLIPIATNDGVGEWLRYDPTYGKIRDARREEDDGMNREPWEGELKRANWQEVERLCGELLTTQTKDLQLVLWFLEARIHLQGIKDLQNCTDFLLKYIQNFWQNTYPQITDDPTQEFRIHLLEAFLRSACEQIVLEPINELSQFFTSPINLSKCFEADNLEKSSKRGGDAAEFFQKAILKGLVTMDRIRNALREVSQEKGVLKVKLIEEIIKNINSTDTLLSEKIGNESPRFDEIINLLGELKGLYNLCQKIPEERVSDQPDQTKLTPNLSAEENTEKTNKDSNVINDIITLEPHSPSPALIKLVSSWENKTLSQILAELQTSPVEVRSLINMLSKATKLENLPTVSNGPNQPQTSNDLDQLSSLVVR
ncbi:MAG: type VI secretion system ImpA family N-terminal domain-containing protein [Proteobacteria bacterium]|nr:type VI secretion system ImpA family N-terminal domain-containing protein [Pseudomonadota bacterium]